MFFKKNILLFILATLFLFLVACSPSYYDSSNSSSFDSSNSSVDHSTSNAEPRISIDQSDGTVIEIGEIFYLSVTKKNITEKVTWAVSNENATITSFGWLTGAKAGECIVTASASGVSDSITVTIVEPELPPVLENPYEDMTAEQFYSNYTPATNYQDALFRSECGFMSGDISEQDQRPTLSPVIPKQGDYYIKNCQEIYSEDKNTYYVVDYSGQIVNSIYKGGAYVTLEEVASYVYAFGEVPVNYSENKSGNPSTSKWGKYLRLNHSKFSGNTSRYPYEPELPNISGCGGTFTYYEIDIGTTGTDCDPKYDSVIYNDGYTITRGAARIVYARYEYSTPLTDPKDKYVFYTYNHYNDFQEYLNYQGGWGEMFGNITGGGTISSKYDYNPTDYVEVVFENFSNNNLLSKTTYFKKYATNFALYC